MGVPGPSAEALELHRAACERGEDAYTNPDTGLFVMTSVYHARRGRCCGNGCRHCPYPDAAQRQAGRPNRPAWPWTVSPPGGLG